MHNETNPIAKRRKQMSNFAIPDGHYSVQEIRAALFAEAQSILHSGMILLRDKDAYTYGPMTLHKETRLEVANTGVPYLVVLEIILSDGSLVFKANYLCNTDPVISFPPSLYSAENIHQLKVDGVIAYRQGRWRRELQQHANEAIQRLTETKNTNFEPIDDEDLWNE